MHHFFVLLSLFMSLNAFARPLALSDLAILYPNGEAFRHSGFSFFGNVPQLDQFPPLTSGGTSTFPVLLMRKPSILTASAQERAQAARDLPHPHVHKDFLR